MVMWKQKGCPKCGGDMFLDIDEDIWFDHCLQCGYINPRSEKTCPKCGREMLLDADDDNLYYYYCSHCGHTIELHRAVK
jgi:ribosomal protein S27AE